MHRISVTREMSNDVAAVWSVLDDFGSVYKYNPGVKSSSILGQKATGLGAQRICNFYDGSSLKETITKYEPNHGYSFRLHDFALPLKEATSHFKLTPLSGGRSLLSITLEFVPKFGPLGWLLGKVMMRPMLRKALRALTKGLEDHMNTGELIGKDGALMGQTQRIKHQHAGTPEMGVGR